MEKNVSVIEKQNPISLLNLGVTLILVSAFVLGLSLPRDFYLATDKVHISEMQPLDLDNLFALPPEDLKLGLEYLESSPSEKGRVIRPEPLAKEAYMRYINALPEPIVLDKRLRCLALNIYFESRGEPLKGKYAVALVTMGRVESRSYPDNICGVVWKKGWSKKRGKWVAHFSWTLDGKSDIPKDKVKWQESQDIAIFIGTEYPNLIMADLGLSEDMLHATHFHADYSSPNWKKDFIEVAVIGRHIFYR